MGAEVFPGILSAPIPVSPIAVRRNYTVCWVLHTRNGLSCCCWWAVPVHHCSARAPRDPFPSCGTTEPNYKSRSVSRCVFNTQHLSLREGKVIDSRHQPHSSLSPICSAPFKPPLLPNAKQLPQALRMCSPSSVQHSFMELVCYLRLAKGPGGTKTPIFPKKYCRERESFLP